MNKMMSLALVGAIALLILGVGLITASVIDEAMDPDLSEAEAMRIAEEEIEGGEAIDIELEEELGGPVYEVKVVDADGTVWEVEIDGDTGEVLEIELDDDGYEDDDDDDDDEEDDD